MHNKVNEAVMAFRRSRIFSNAYEEANLIRGAAGGASSKKCKRKRSSASNSLLVREIADAVSCLSNLTRMSVVVIEGDGENDALTATTFGIFPEVAALLSNFPLTTVQTSGVRLLRIPYLPPLSDVGLW